MPASAPRLGPRLLDLIERLARRRGPIAEINRRVGEEAERLGLPRPSYEHVRRLVHEARRLHAHVPSRADVAARAAFEGKRGALLIPEIVAPRPRLRDRVEPEAK